MQGLALPWKKFDVLAQGFARRADRAAENPGGLYPQKENPFVGGIALLQGAPKLVFALGKPFRSHGVNFRRRLGVVRPIFRQQSLACD